MPISDVIHDLADFCGTVQALRVVHKRIRSAGKGVKFHKSDYGIPEPAPTASQRETMQKYDQRTSESSILFSNLGTVLYNFQLDLNSILLTYRSFFKYRIPIAALEFFQPLINDLEVEGDDYLIQGRLHQ